MENTKVFETARGYLDDIYDAQNSMETSVEKVRFLIMRMKMEKGAPLKLNYDKVDSNIVTFDEILSSNTESLYFFQRLYQVTLNEKELLALNTLCSVVMKKCTI